MDLHFLSEVLGGGAAETRAGIEEACCHPGSGEPRANLSSAHEELSSAKSRPKPPAGTVS